MRNGHLMSDRADERGPVQVQLTIRDWQYVPTRTHKKVVEIDRDDWDYAEPAERREIIGELQQEFVVEVFETDWNVLGDADISDDVRVDGE